MIKKIITIVLAAMFVLSLAGCQSKNTETANTTSTTTNNNESQKGATIIDKIKQSSKLVVATSAEYPPFESVDPKDGKTVIGFDIDIANAVAKKLGVSLEIKDMDFNGLLGALMGDKADMVIAGMSATDERKKSVDFSNTYFDDTFVVVVKEGDESIKTPADLKGKKVGGQLGSTGEAIAKSIPGIEYKALNDNDQLVMEVKSGRLDAVVLNLTTSLEYSKSIGGVKLVDMPELNNNPDTYAVAVKKGNTELLNVINQVIDELKSGGEYDKMIEKWGLKIK